MSVSLVHGISGRIKTSPKTDDHYSPADFLKSLFKSPDQIEKALNLLRSDRLFDQNQLVLLLKECLQGSSYTHPLFRLITLILDGNEYNLVEREQAAQAYIREYPEDKQFELHYAFLRQPTILMAHLLIISGYLKPNDPKNLKFYDEQIADLFHGNLSFEEGEILINQEVLKIKEKGGHILEDLHLNEVPAGSLENPTYTLKTRWSSLKIGDFLRLDELYIRGRRDQQEVVLNEYFKDLEQTSSVLKESFPFLPDNSVFCVIGPYGVGKSTFVKKQLYGKPYTQFGLDDLRPRLGKEFTDQREQDHRFEAMVLKTSLNATVAKLSHFVAESAAIDGNKFERIFREYVTRNAIYIYEIAPTTPEESLIRYSKKFPENAFRIAAARVACMNAQNQRQSRLEEALRQPKVHYSLLHSFEEGKTLSFESIAEISRGKLTILDTQRYIQLLSPIPIIKD